MTAIETPVLPDDVLARIASGESVLVLRTTDSDGRSHGGFQWPEGGPVSCSDWSPVAECGNGLHGWRWGEGDGSLGDWSETARWLVVEVVASKVVDLSNDGSIKCKFPDGVVLYSGDRSTAAAIIAEHAPAGTMVIGATITGGDRATITGGYGATITGGYGATITGGYGATLQVRWWDAKAERYRVSIGYVGEDGIRAGVGYCVRDGKLVEAKVQP